MRFMAQPNQEPSMEDILASIKRIIAEDSEAVGVRPAKLRREAMAAVSSSPIIAPVQDAEPEPEREASPDPVKMVRDLAERVATLPPVPEPLLPPELKPDPDQYADQLTNQYAH